MTSTFIALAVAVLLIAAIASFGARTVSAGTVGLLYRDGIFDRQLQPGRHRIVDPFGRTILHIIPVAPLPSPAYQLGLISKDQFAFRLSVVAFRRIADPRAFFESQPATELPLNLARRTATDPFALRADRLQPLLASALLAWAGTRTLEEIVACPSPAMDDLIPALEAALPGVAIDRLLATELTLPPEVRKMFTEVERARREGLAQLERARAEQASLRALANAARTLQSNPQLAQLRLLQTMDGARGNKTFVLGSPTLDAAAATAAPSTDD